MIRFAFICLLGAFAVGLLPPAGQESPDPPGRHQPDREQDTILAGLRRGFRKVGAAPPGRRESLDQAAERILQRVGDAPPSELPSHWSQTVRFELLRVGVPEPQFLPLLLDADNPEAMSRKINRLVTRGIVPRGMNRYGLAMSRVKGRLRVSLVLIRCVVELSTFSLRVEPEGSQLFWGVISPGFHSPRVLMITPGGASIEMSPRTADDMFWSRLYFPETGRYTIEVMVQGPGGAETAALFPIYSGVNPPRLPSVKLCPAPPEQVRAETLEREVLAMINRERRRRSLPELISKPLLVRCAREHSKAMAGSGLVAHRIPDEDRRGCPQAHQNIALDRTLCGAHSQLMSSPSHRRNLLNGEFRYCGVGVTTREVLPGMRLYYVTQEFADPRTLARLAGADCGGNHQSPARVDSGRRDP